MTPRDTPAPVADGRKKLQDAYDDRVFHRALLADRRKRRGEPQPKKRQTQRCRRGRR